MKNCKIASIGAILFLIGFIIFCKSLLLNDEKLGLISIILFGIGALMAISFKVD